jgi:4-hydroxy-tetrahydrodipicolinate reductase
LSEAARDNPSPVRVAVCGAAGRLGGAVLRKLAADAKRFHVTASLIRPDSALIGQSVALDLLQVPEFTADTGTWRNPRVLFDASRADAVARHAEQAAGDGVAVVVAVTGLAPAAIHALDQAAQSVPVLVSANLSLGVAVLARLLREAAARLPGYDVEIVEAHHTAKKDAPSGTALWLGQEAARARGWPWPDAARTGRAGETGPRPSREIGIASIRAGTVTGEHRVWLGGPGEHLELVHVAENRDAFASGALEAIAFVAGASPGRYTMEDVTGSN